jgi:hypothetical protein
MDCANYFIGTQIAQINADGEDSQTLPSSQICVHLRDLRAPKAFFL